MLPRFLRNSSGSPGKNPPDSLYLRDAVIRCARDKQPIHDLVHQVTIEHLAELSDRKEELRAAQADLEVTDAQAEAFSIDALRIEIKAGAQQIVSQAVGDASEIEALRNERDDAQGGYNAYLSARNLAPGKPQSARPIPIFVIGAFAAGEGLLSGSVFYQAGAVPTIGAGITLGLTAAAVTGLGAGFIGGHLIGRNFNVGADAAISSRSDTQARWAARLSGPVVAGGLVLLHGALATARATGTLEDGVATFLSDPVTVFRTLESTLLFGFGVGSSVLAWSEGLSAFGDPDPGRERAYSRSIGAMNHSLEEARDRANERVDDAEEDLHERIADAIEEVSSCFEGRAENVAAFGQDRAALDEAIEDAIERIEASQASMIALYRSITGKAPPAFKCIDPDAIRARFLVTWEPQDGPASHLESEIEQCRTQVIEAAAEARLMITASFHGEIKEVSDVA